MILNLTIFSILPHTGEKKKKNTIEVLDIYDVIIMT